jgi:hypothetical protein
MKIRQPRGTTEKAIEASIVRNLRILGLTVIKLSQPQRVLATAGTPDLLVMSPRHRLHLFVEVKTARGRIRPAQAVWHRLATESGLAVMVARSTEDVLHELKRLGMPVEVWT